MLLQLPFGVEAASRQCGVVQCTCDAMSVPQLPWACTVSTKYFVNHHVHMHRSRCELQHMFSLSLSLSLSTLSLAYIVPSRSQKNTWCHMSAHVQNQGQCFMNNVLLWCIGDIVCSMSISLVFYLLVSTWVVSQLRKTLSKAVSAIYVLA